jgi:hypothetical protein
LPQFSVVTISCSFLTKIHKSLPTAQPAPRQNVQHLLVIHLLAIKETAMKKSRVPAVLVVLIGWVAVAQSQLTPASSEVTVDQIVSMSQESVSDNVILALLHKNNRSYDLTPEKIIELKKDQVSEVVIQTLLDPKYIPPQPQAQALAVTTTISPAANPSGATIPVGGTAAGDPNDPLSPHDSGIYLFSEGKMTELDRAASQAQKVTGVLATTFTFGLAPVKFKAEIPGVHAEIQTPDANPVFYFYFDDKPAGLGKSRIITLSSPYQFVLLKLHVANENRELTAGSTAFYGSSVGTDLKSRIQFKSERIRPGLYKITLEQPLKPGEYCFLASAGNAGAAMPTDIYDFGIAGAKE